MDTSVQPQWRRPCHIHPHPQRIHVSARPQPGVVSYALRVALTGSDAKPSRLLDFGVGKALLASPCDTIHSFGRRPQTEDQHSRNGHQ